MCVCVSCVCVCVCELTVTYMKYFPFLLPSFSPSLPPSLSQSELRDRSDSDMLSLDQLDNELAQWEEELGEEGEGEEGGAGEGDEHLLNSKTDDDLMLEFAEFL